MNLIQSIFLGIVQGLSEFLPISSSGHLNLFQHLFGLKPSLIFDVFFNTATFFSVLFFFRKKINYFFQNLIFIFIGSIPAVIIGFLFKSKFEIIFSNIKYLPFFFLITAALIFSTKFFKNKEEKIDYKKALIIGLFQALAILPGVSRAGSTIFAGLLVGLSPLEAFNFSFCLFIPASLGALLLNIKEIKGDNFLNTNYIISFLVTFVVGIISLFLLKKILINQKIWIFSIYLVLLSVFMFIFLRS